jgi:DNA polymerase iota
MPNFVFNLIETDESLAERLVQEALIPAFRKLHPEKSGWNLSLVNIAGTNMAETAAETKDSEGRDIGRMLKRQDEVLKDWRVMDREPLSEDPTIPNASREIQATPAEWNKGDSNPYQGTWESDDSADDSPHICEICGNMMPLFAAAAHDRYHSME